MKRLFFFAVMLLSYIANISAQDLDAKYATDLLKPGSEAPAFKLKGNTGYEFSLDDVRGYYVVLDFWASWCPDCRKDIPAVKSLYEKYEAKGVKFVGVSFDNDAQAWNNCIAKNEMTWTQVSELKRMKESDVAKKYRVNWIPTLYLITPDGKIDMATVEITKLEKRLSEIYSQASAAPAKYNKVVCKCIL